MHHVILGVNANDKPDTDRKGNFCMNILLDGYFDNNFGDDLMRMIVAENIPECNFYVNAPMEMTAHLDEFRNVYVTDEIPATDAYLNVIGTGFLYNSKMAQLNRILSILLDKRKKHPKTALVDCSIEPVGNIASDMLTAYDLRKFGHITCRDAVSFDYIKEKCRNTNIKKYNDIVFAVDDSYIYENSGEECLGIIPATRFGKKGNYDYFNILAATADNYAEKYNKPILIFALDSACENDVFAALSIKRMMKNQDMAEIIAYNSKPRYVFQNISRCKKIISSRFHGIIASILSNVAVIGISDRQKIDILAQELGFELIRKDKLNEALLTEFINNDKKAVCLPKNYREDAFGHITALRKYLETDG